MEANLTTSCWACNRGKGGRPINQIWLLTDGPDEPGPLDGQTIQSASKYPVLWVYKYPDGECETWNDELDVLYQDQFPWESRLKFGVPFGRNYLLGIDGGGDADRYRDVIGIHGGLGKFLGLYIPFSNFGEKPDHGMFWISAREVFSYVSFYTAQVDPAHKTWCEVVEATGIDPDQ